MQVSFHPLVFLSSMASDVLVPLHAYLMSFSIEFALQHPNTPVIFSPCSICVFFFHLPLVSSPEGSLLPVQRSLDVRSHLGLFVGRFIIESHMIAQGSRFIQHKCTASNHLSEGLIDCTEKVTKCMHLLRYVMYLTVFQVHAMLFRPVWSSHRRAGTPSRYIWLGFTGVT